MDLQTDIAITCCCIYADFVHFVTPAQAPASQNGQSQRKPRNTESPENISFFSPTRSAPVLDLEPLFQFSAHSVHLSQNAPVVTAFFLGAFRVTNRLTTQAKEANATAQNFQSGLTIQTPFLGDCFRYCASLIERRRYGATRGHSSRHEKRRAVLRAGRRVVAERRFGSRRRFIPFGPATEARLRRGAQRARTRAWRARADRGRDQFVPRGGSIAPRFRRSPRQSRPGLAAKRRTRRRDRRASRGCRSSTRFGRVPQRLRIRARAERPSRRGRRRIRVCREARPGFSRGAIPPGRDSVVATTIRRRHRAAARGDQTQTGSRRIALLPRPVAAEDGPTARDD